MCESVDAYNGSTFTNGNWLWYRCGTDKRYDSSETRPMNITPVAPGVFQLRAFRAGVVVITTQEGITLVDAGPRGGLAFVREGLHHLGSSLSDVNLVVITHCHPDHTGGLNALKNATGARVAVHHDDADNFSRVDTAREPFRVSLLNWVTKPISLLLSGNPVPVDVLLEDGDLLPTPEKVRVIHTPGHTLGSICLHMPSKKVLITGDALQHRFGRLRLPADLVTQDRILARKSLEKLMDLDFDVMCFSHFTPLTQNPKNELRRLLVETDRP